MPGVAWSCLELPRVQVPALALPRVARPLPGVTLRPLFEHIAITRPKGPAFGPSDHNPNARVSATKRPAGRGRSGMTAQKNAGRHPTQLGKTIVAENVENYKAAPEGGLRKARSTPTPFCRPKAVYHQKTLRHGTWILPRKTAKIAAPFFDAPMCETGAVKRPKIVKVTLFLSLTNDGSLSNLHSTGIVIPDKFVKKTSAEWAKMARGICGH